MTLYIVLALVALQRIAELIYSARNTKRLLARGGIEVGAIQYPFFVLLHVAWLVNDGGYDSGRAAPNWWLLGLYAVLQPLRVWTIATLGPYWTTRIITVPGAPIVREGPYRIFRHPNYVVVCAEIAILPLAFGAVEIAIVFSILNASLLSWRIRVEERALLSRRRSESLQRAAEARDAFAGVVFREMSERETQRRRTATRRIKRLARHRPARLREHTRRMPLASRFAAEMEARR